MPPLVAKGTFVKDPDDIPTSYVETAFAAPSWSDPDFPPMLLGMGALSFRVFQEVRTKRNLSYAPYAGMQRQLARPYGFLYVTAVDPETTMHVMMDEVNKMKTTPLGDAEFAAQKAEFITNFATAAETTSGRANLLGNAFLLGGDWHLADTLLARVKATTPADVQRVANSAMTGFDTAVVGHPEKLSPATVQATPAK
jgi:zinc protease